MIQHRKIDFTKRSLQNVFSMFAFILYHIIKKSTNLGTYVIIIFLEIIHIIIFQTTSFFFILLFCCLYLLIALEETYHTTMIIVLNKQEALTHIDITKTQIGFISFIGGISVCYTGTFKKSDIFYISLAGPLMPIFYLFIVGLTSIIINLFLPIRLTLFFKVIICSALAPLSAFIPIRNNNYISDGYRIFSFIKTNNIPIKQIFSAITYTIQNMLCITFTKKETSK